MRCECVATRHGTHPQWSPWLTLLPLLPLLLLLLLFLMLLLQAHTQLLCITTLPRGTVTVATGAGNDTTTYDSATLQQFPVVASVTPMVWSTTASTNITIVGDRCGPGESQPKPAGSRCAAPSLHAPSHTTLPLSPPSPPSNARIS